MNFSVFWRSRAPGVLFAACALCVPVAGGQSSAAKTSQCCVSVGHAASDGSSRLTAPAIARFETQANALLDSPPSSKGEWGVFIIDAKSGATLFSRNADSYFVPASNMKLFTTALALARLGPDYKFHTTLETHGQISSNGILRGDLFLVGRGDPNLSNRKFPYDTKEEFDGAPDKVLAELTDKLVARGLKEISGDVIGDDSYFPRERYPDGWEIGDMVWEYGAALSAIVLDDNTVTLTLTPGETAAAPVSASVEPLTPDFALENDVATSAAGAKPDLTLTREPGASLVVIRGSLPAKSTPRKLVLAIEEPAQHAASVLASLLAARGVKLDGQIRAVHDPDPDAAARTVLAEHVSVSLADAVKLINKISQNLHAEMLLRTVARQNGLWSNPDDLFKAPQEFYAAAGIAADEVIQTDGSGLSRHDLVTPRAVVGLLNYAQAQPWFAPYFASLPIAGEDGTLQDRMKGTVAAGRIHGKTGSVEHVRTLSGYADLPDGRRLIFSFLSNNDGGKNHEVLDALNQLCVDMIEDFNEGGAVGLTSGARNKP